MNRVLATNLYKALKEVKQTKISKLPVINHAKLEFTHGELVITSIDVDLNEFSVATCPAIVNEEWSTCVLMVHKVKTRHVQNGYTHGYGNTYKYYPFLDAVKICAEYEDVLELTFDPSIQILTVKVQGEKSTSTFKCMDAYNFPPTK